MIFNFVISKTIETVVPHSKALLQNPQHLQLSVREAVTVFEFMADIGLLDHEIEKPFWNPWRYDFDDTRSHKLALHVRNGALICPPPTNQELDMINRFLEEEDRIASTESPIPGKVPSFKFTVDEFWCVTPRECRIIFQRLGSMVESGELRELIHKLTTGKSHWEYFDNCEFHYELMLQWMYFNELAAVNEGYFIV